MFRDVTPLYPYFTPGGVNMGFSPYVLDEVCSSHQYLQNELLHYSIRLG